MARKPRWRRQLRSRRKFIAVWLSLGLLALGAVLSKKFGIRSIDDVQSLSNVALEILASLVLLVLPFFLWQIYPLRKKNLAASSDTPIFRDQPWMFDKEFIQIIGQVEVVFSNTWDSAMQKRLTNFFRTLTASTDHTGRHQHQRFLLSSPQLRRGEKLMIIANQDADSPKVKAGAWLEVQGEYIHSRAKQRSKWGSPLTYYGKVHYTHPPLGYIKVLKELPRGAQEQGVVVVPDVKRNYLQKTRRGPQEL